MMSNDESFFFSAECLRVWRSTLSEYNAFVLESVSYLFLGIWFLPTLYLCLEGWSSPLAQRICHLLKPGSLILDNGNVCWSLSWFLDIYAREVTVQALQHTLQFQPGKCDVDDMKCHFWSQGLTLSLSCVSLPPTLSCTSCTENSCSSLYAKCRFPVQQSHCVLWAPLPVCSSPYPPALQTQCINSVLPS